MHYYNRDKIDHLINFIFSNNGINNKNALEKLVQDEFSLVLDRRVYYCEDFAIRFSKTNGSSFSNTVLALSALHNYDDRPFLVCTVAPEENKLFLANSTFLKKISHSSQELRCDNIKGSFNGSDILREYANYRNIPENFENLYSSHINFTFEENLARLVESTNNIVPTGHKFVPTNDERCCIFDSVKRSCQFIESAEYNELNRDLQNRLNSVKNEIIIASAIENVNIRGRVIEYLITSHDDLRDTLVTCLRTKKPLPKIFTDDKLGDYERDFVEYLTETDIKTKVLIFCSNPKGYNIDKLLAFLSHSRSVYLIYIVTIAADAKIDTFLCSVFNSKLISGTRVIKHWAGRNSRGVTQYDGHLLEEIVKDRENVIDERESIEFIKRLLSE